MKLQQIIAIIKNCLHLSVMKEWPRSDYSNIPTYQQIFCIGNSVEATSRIAEQLKQANAFHIY
jgi:hypothetical protein